jgi:hypothetical protein
MDKAFTRMLRKIGPAALAAGQLIVFEVFCGDLGERTSAAEEMFETCKKLIPTAHKHPVVFAAVFDHSPFQDMAAIAAADHIILTAGTFGWWGGYTNRRGVVISTDLVGLTGIDKAATDFYPPHFELVS